ncbi:MAG TPA: transglutaminase domain-containing protein [Vicinamibacteria bacterium]|nr:transglutaminase domain-containing protein [Vicinamibacteria bacterium]
MKRVATSVLFGAAGASVAVNLRTAPAWLFVLVAAASIFWRSRTPAPGTVRACQRLLYLLLIGIAILGWIQVTYPILSAQEVDTWALRLAYPVGALGSLFLLTARTVFVWTGVIPAAVGMLVTASFDANTRTLGFLAAAGLAGFSYLAADVWSLSGERRLTRSVLVGGFGLLSAAIATVIVLILPWTQGKVEETMLTIYAPTGDGIEGQHQTRLGDLQRLKLSEKIVMRVWSERPQKLRSRVFTHIDGAYWRRDLASIRTLAPSMPQTIGLPERQFLATLPGKDFVPTPERLEGQRLIRTKVVRVDGGGLATPGGSALVHAPVDEVRIDGAGVLFQPPSTRVRLYGVLHELNHQRAQDGPLQPEERERALQVPENLDPRIPELAKVVTDGAATTEKAVERVVAHLRESYEYSLEVGEIDRQNPLVDFLFNKKRGWCEFFAGAAALMLRTEDIPTRYVEGFNVIGSQRKDDYYIVREWDRHAWIEAYIDGKGWLEYDPTPAAEYESLHAGLDSGPLADAIEWIRAHGASLYAEIRHVEWRGLLGPLAWLAGFFVAGYGALHLARLWSPRRRVTRRGTSAPLTGLEPLIQELDRRARALGSPRTKTKAPLEYWATVSENVPVELRNIGLRIVERFYHARYGGALVPPEEIRLLERELNSLGSRAPSSADV